MTMADIIIFEKGPSKSDTYTDSEGFITLVQYYSQGVDEYQDALRGTMMAIKGGNKVYKSATLFYHSEEGSDVGI